MCLWLNKCICSGRTNVLCLSCMKLEINCLPKKHKKKSKKKQKKNTKNKKKHKKTYQEKEKNKSTVIKR